MPRSSLNDFFVICAIMLGTTVSVCADLNSPELECLQKQIAPYVLPTELGSKIIPSVSLSGATFDSVSQILEPHGVTIVTSESLREVKLNIALRNLSINRVMQFVTQQVNARWFYQDGRIIVFRSTEELNDDFKKIYAKKAELDKQIHTERRRLGKILEEANNSALRKTIITEFSVTDRTISEIISELSEASVEAGHADGKGVNIVPLFNPKSHKETHTYTLRNQSIAEILDTLCEDSKMTWRVGQDAVTVSPK